MIKISSYATSCLAIYIVFILLKDSLMPVRFVGLELVMRQYQLGQKESTRTFSEAFRQIF